MKSDTKQSIGILVRCYHDYQRERKALDGRLGIKKDGGKKKFTPPRNDELLIDLYERHTWLLSMEDAMKKQIKIATSDHPLWIGFLRDVTGVAEITTGVLISEIDIYKADTVSKLRQFCGMNPGQKLGKVWKKRKGGRVLVESDTMIRGDKKTKGFVCPYNCKRRCCQPIGVGRRTAFVPGQFWRAWMDYLAERVTVANLREGP